MSGAIVGKSKKRDDREAELTAMAIDQPGREKLLDEFVAAFGFGGGKPLPVCSCPRDAIEAILAKEFPVE